MRVINEIKSTIISIKKLSKHYVPAQQLHAPSSRLDISRLRTVLTNAPRLVLAAYVLANFAPKIGAYIYIYIYLILCLPYLTVPYREIEKSLRNNNNKFISIVLKSIVLSLFP